MGIDKKIARKYQSICANRQVKSYHLKRQLKSKNGRKASKMSTTNAEDDKNKGTILSIPAPTPTDLTPTSVITRNISNSDNNNIQNRN